MKPEVVFRHIEHIPILVGRPTVIFALDHPSRGVGAVWAGFVLNAWEDENHSVVRFETDDAYYVVEGGSGDAAKQKKGEKMKKLVYGVGVNDLPYRVNVYEELPKNGGKRTRKLVFRCPYYTTWKSMLERCYSEKFLESYPTYIGTSVCSEWLYASEFKKWMEQQDWSGKCLDKDIIVPRSKLYSPDTCAFVLPATNTFVVACDASRGDYPIGVYLFKRTGRYRAQCENPFTGKGEHLGYFSTPKEAHEAWRERKHELAQLVAATESDTRVVEALKKRYSFEES